MTARRPLKKWVYSCFAHLPGSLIRLSDVQTTDENFVTFDVFNVKTYRLSAFRLDIAIEELLPEKLLELDRNQHVSV